MAALRLFLIMLTWQMPHFFAIAIRRHDDYVAAKIPVMSVKHGIWRAKTSMMIYIVEFMIAALSLYMFAYAGPVYAGVVSVLGIAWLTLCMYGFHMGDEVSAHAIAANKKWAKQMFFFSLIVLVVLFITVSIGAIV
jgi:protoheme IX farnesyltransferase